VVAAAKPTSASGLALHQMLKTLAAITSGLAARQNAGLSAGSQALCSMDFTAAGSAVALSLLPHAVVDSTPVMVDADSVAEKLSTVGTLVADAAQETAAAEVAVQPVTPGRPEPILKWPTVFRLLIG